MLWGPLMRTVASVTAPKDQPLAAIIMTSSIICGSIAAYTLSAQLLTISWLLAFRLPGALFIAYALIFFLLLPRAEPALPSRPEFTKKPPLTALPALILSGGLICLLLISALHGMIKESLNVWGPTMLTEAYGLIYSKALTLFAAAPVINFIGLLLCGFWWLRRQKDMAGTMARLFVFCALSAAMLSWCMGGDYLVGFALIAVISALMTVINNILLSLIPLHYASQGRVSTVSGCLDFAAYLGAGLAGPLAGMLADNDQWHLLAASWAAVSLPALICLRIYKLSAKKALRPGP
jgi:OPA family glycerol-3-phosphate transporter-like MFS transporter